MAVYQIKKADGGRTRALRPNRLAQPGDVYEVLLSIGKVKRGTLLTVLERNTTPNSLGNLSELGNIETRASDGEERNWCSFDEYIAKGRIQLIVGEVSATGRLNEQ